MDRFEAAIFEARRHETRDRQMRYLLQDIEQKLRRWQELGEQPASIWIAHIRDQIRDLL